MSQRVIDTTQTVTFVPASRDRTNSNFYSWTIGGGSGPLREANASVTTNYDTLQYVRETGADSYFYYDFNITGIPSSNVLINYIGGSVQIRVANTQTSYFRTKEVYFTNQLQKLTSSGNINSTSAQNIVTIPSYDDSGLEDLDLNGIKLCVHLVKGTSNNNASTFIYGANLDINYSTYHYEYDITVLNNTDKVSVTGDTYTLSEGQSQTISFVIANLNAVAIEDNFQDIKSQLVNTTGNTYTYTISNIGDDHIITCENLAIDISDEDPNYDYHTLSISGINISTVPAFGSHRYVDGSNVVINLNPDEPNLRLALDNGVDISNNLVVTSSYTYTYTTSNVSGTTSWTNNNGVYSNGNAGNNNTRSTIQFNFNTSIPCLVTFYYWGTLTGNDAICFGNLNQTLTTDGTQDSTTVRKHWKGGTFTYAEADAFAVSYENVEGSNFVQVKVRRNNNTSGAVNHTAYVRVEITPMVPETYQYTISNMDTDHSLVFVFGDVVYYTVQETTSLTGLTVFPTGSWVVLPDDSYKLTVIPDNSIIQLEVEDNGTAQQMERVEYVNDNNDVVINYVYKLFNINENHIINIVEKTPNVKLYMKINGIFTEVSQVYKKINNVWTEVSIDSLTDPGPYIYKG